MVFATFVPQGVRFIRNTGRKVHLRISPSKVPGTLCTVRSCTGHPGYITVVFGLVGMRDGAGPKGIFEGVSIVSKCWYGRVLEILDRSSMSLGRAGMRDGPGSYLQGHPLKRISHGVETVFVDRVSPATWYGSEFAAR